MQSNILLEENNCPICLEILKNDFITVNCCNKQFHTCCFLNCINVKKECPMCRNEFTETLIPVPVTQPQPQPQQFISMTRSQLMCSIFCSSSIVCTFLVLMYIFSSK